MRRCFYWFLFLLLLMARAQAARCIQCPQALCMTGCPLANRIPEWMALTGAGPVYGGG